VKLQQYDSAGEVAVAGADFIFACASESLKLRDRFILALSGGSTPWQMLAVLAEYDLPWHKIHIMQVDERAVPEASPERNLFHIRNVFSEAVSLPEGNLHAMPVEGKDLDEGARQYQLELEELAGTPPGADVVHLGLGSDGHTASLVPGDPVLEVMDRDVAVSLPYNGRPRMTLTYPFINRARRIMWLMTGSGKVEMANRLIQNDRTIPAGLISRHQATIIADTAAIPPNKQTGVPE